MAAIITAEGLGKRYTIGSSVGGYSRLTEEIADGFTRLFRRDRAERVEATARELWALRDVSFEVEPGEIVGVVGRNGAGKTTLLKLLSRITSPTEGRAELRGRVGSLLEVGTGFHPELTGRENVFLNGAILGMSRTEIRSKFDDIVDFAEVSQFVDTPVKRYSSGMYVRLAFAVAAYLETEILFVDEVLSVGDQAFQQRCIGRIGEIARGGRTIIYVSHNLASVSSLCTRALLVDGGRLLKDGTTDEILDYYVSSIQTLAGETLDHREDRQGDGRLRLVWADVLGPGGGPPRSGDDSLVRLGYRAQEPPRKVMATVAVEGALGEPVFFCSSEVSGHELDGDALEGEISCSIPSLPLLPGRYTANVALRMNGVLTDWIQNAIFFDVFESDVFGTGRLPPTSHGRIFVEHSWDIGSGDTEELIRLRSGGLAD